MLAIVSGIYLIIIMFIPSQNNNNNAVGQVQQTRPGFNKSRRDIARIILWLVAATLLCGLHVEATCFSAAAVLVLKEGTFFSVKNMKWMILSAISFAASLLSLNMKRGADAVDEERAYSMKIMLWIATKSISTGWGVTLGLFLLSAATMPPPIENTSSVSNGRKQR